MGKGLPCKAQGALQRGNSAGKAAGKRLGLFDGVMARKKSKPACEIDGRDGQEAETAPQEDIAPTEIGMPTTLTMSYPPLPSPPPLQDLDEEFIAYIIPVLEAKSRMPMLDEDFEEEQALQHEDIVHETTFAEQGMDVDVASTIGNVSTTADDAEFQKERAM